MYTNIKGETSIRFTNYSYSNHKDLYNEIELESEMMNAKMIEEGYEVDEALKEAENKYKENKSITFKYKGCKTGNSDITKVEKYFKTCEYRTNNLGYR